MVSGVSLRPGLSSLRRKKRETSKSVDDRLGLWVGESEEGQARLYPLIQWTVPGYQHAFITDVSCLGGSRRFDCQDEG